MVEPNSPTVSHPKRDAHLPAERRPGQVAPGLATFYVRLLREGHFVGPGSSSTHHSAAGEKTETRLACSVTEATACRLLQLHWVGEHPPDPLQARAPLRGPSEISRS